MVMIPPKPKVIGRDFKRFFRRDGRHNIVALLFALAIPAFVIWVFAQDSALNIEPGEPPITYVNIWEEGRTNEQIIERQRQMSLVENERRAERRRQMQALADASGVDYDREAAAEADRITQENRDRLSRPGDDALIPTVGAEESSTDAP